MGNFFTRYQSPTWRSKLEAEYGKIDPYGS